MQARKACEDGDIEGQVTTRDVPVDWYLFIASMSTCSLAGQTAPSTTHEISRAMRIRLRTQRSYVRVRCDHRQGAHNMYKGVTANCSLPPIRAPVCRYRRAPSYNSASTDCDGYVLFCRTILGAGLFVEAGGALSNFMVGALDTCL